MEPGRSSFFKASLASSQVKNNLSERKAVVMAVSKKTGIENKPAFNGTGAEPQRPEAGAATEAGMAPVETVKTETSAGRPRKKGTAFRLVVALLALALAGE